MDAHADENLAAIEAAAAAYPCPPASPILTASRRGSNMSDISVDLDDVEDLGGQDFTLMADQAA